MGNEHSYTSTVEPRLTATSIIRSPRNYGQFFRSGKTTMDFVIKNPVNAVTCQYCHGHILKSQTAESLKISPLY